MLAKALECLDALDYLDPGVVVDLDLPSGPPVSFEGTLVVVFLLGI